MKLRFASPFVATFLLAACGGSVDAAPGPAGDQDTGVSPTLDTGAPVEDTTPVAEDTAPSVDAPDTAVPTDHGAPSDTYPAFTPDMPSIVDNGGDVLKAPVIVTVTFAADPNAAQYEAFGDGIGATSYWKDIVSEYGVGPATSGATNHVREAASLPASMADTDLDAYINDHVTNYAKYGWPAPSDQHIYALYIPKTTAVSLQGNDACTSGIGGYHTSTNAAGIDIAYAIVMQCQFGSKATTPRTVSASHELAEAATDPHPQTGAPGYYGVDDDHLAWDLFMSGNVENGDLCEIYREQRYSDTIDPGFAFNVQRCWSNASAKAGHSPCVTAPTTIGYWNVSPLEIEKVTFNAVSIGGSSRQATKGYKIPMGETRTFQVGVWSDVKTGPLYFRVSEGSPLATTTPTKHLTIKADRTTGVNGEKVNVTVTVNTVPGTKGSVLTFVTSDDPSPHNGTEHYMPILISSQ